MVSIAQEKPTYLSEKIIEALNDKSVLTALSKAASIFQNTTLELTPLAIEEAVKLLSTSKPTLNKLVRNKLIRSYQFPCNKRIYFIREELVEDLRQFPKF